MSFQTIRQVIVAGSNFNGIKPSGELTEEPSRELQSHAASGNGGRFRFSSTKRGKLRRVVLDVTTATGWTISLTSRGVTAELFNSTDFVGNTVVISGPELALIDRGDSVDLVTTGASGEISAEMTFEEI